MVERGVAEKGGKSGKERGKAAVNTREKERRQPLTGRRRKGWGGRSGGSSSSKLFLRHMRWLGKAMGDGGGLEGKRARKRTVEGAVKKKREKRGTEKYASGKLLKEGETYSQDPPSGVEKANYDAEGQSAKEDPGRNWDGTNTIPKNQVKRRGAKERGKTSGETTRVIAACKQCGTGETRYSLEKQRKKSVKEVGDVNVALEKEFMITGARIV